MVASHQFVWERQNQNPNTDIGKTEKGNKGEITNYQLIIPNRKIVFI